MFFKRTDYKPGYTYTTLNYSSPKEAGLCNSAHLQFLVSRAGQTGLQRENQSQLASTPRGKLLIHMDGLMLSGRRLILTDIHAVRGHKAP